jgi:ABC-type multidrug transport system ATPase subunit
MESIVINGISKRFGKTVALDEVHFEIPNESIFFLMGLNGAGKTTLMKVMAGLLYPDKGQIVFNGYKKEIGCLIETPNFYEKLTAYQNLKHQAIMSGYSDEQIVEALNAVKLEPYNKKSVKKFSLGMKQRLGIARAIMGEHDIIMLDEPLIGLDPAGISDINKLILSLRASGKTIFLSSHLIKETEGLATDYAILHKGKIIIQFSVDELSSVCKCIKINMPEENGKDKLMNLINASASEIGFVEIGDQISIYSKVKDNKLIESYAERIIKECNMEMGKDIIIDDGSLEELFLALTMGGTDDVSYS